MFWVVEEGCLEVGAELEAAHLPAIEVHPIISPLNPPRKLLTYHHGSPLDFLQVKLDCGLFLYVTEHFLYYLFD